MKISKKLLLGIGTLAAVVVALLLAPVQAQPSRQAECSFSGIWRTTYAQMTLDQSGTTVSGTYGIGPKKVRAPLREVC